MSIKAYVGRMGSGKTYEVVTGVILGGLRRGRRVVSNIAGLNFEAMQQVLLSEGMAESDIGELIQIDHEKVLDQYFWRSDSEPAASKPLPDSNKVWRKVRHFTNPEDAPDSGLETFPTDYFIQPGDLVALDEIWRFWSGFSTKDDDGKKRPATVMNFFRMHRHFIHPDTGVACDVALITQDVMDISRQVRAVIEETYYMEKLTAIGSSSRYRVDIFQGGRTNRRPLRSLQRSYDPQMFPLYSSHSQKKEGGADAIEVNIDKRGNILSGPMFKFILPVGALVFGVAIWSVMGFFKQGQQPKDKPAVSDEKVAHVSNVSPAKTSADISEEWRASGYVDNGSRLVVYLSQDRKSRVIVDPPKSKIFGQSIEVVLPDGKIVADWSGSQPSGLIPQNAK